MMKFHFILLFALLSCHKKSFYQAPDTVNSYVQNFITEGKKRGIKVIIEKRGLIIEFDSLLSNQAGRCRPNDSPRVITINKAMWKDLDSFQRRALIFHELGHCVLMRNHNNKLLPRGECVSLLAGKEEGFKCSQNLYSIIWWKYYLDELFNKKKSLHGIRTIKHLIYKILKKNT